MEPVTGYFHANGYRLRYAHWAAHDHTAPAWVLLHDGLGSIGQWRGFPAALARMSRMPVYAWERRGYGLSDDVQHARNIHYMHEEACELHDVVLDQLPHPDVFLLGHSDGASIALMQQHPKVKAVIALAAHVMVEDVTLAGIRQVHESGMKQVIIEKLKKYHGKRAAEVYARWAETWLQPDFRHWDIRAELRRLACPLLAMQGDADEYGTVRQLADIKRYTLNDCRLVMLPQCGHAPHLDHEVAVMYEIFDFLRGFSLI